MRKWDLSKWSDPLHGAAFTIEVVPQANKTEVVSILPDGTVKIRLMASPVASEINEELIAFLTEFLQVPAKDIEIMAGVDSRKLLVTVLNVRAEEISRRFEEAAQEDLRDQE